MRNPHTQSTYAPHISWFVEEVHFRTELNIVVPDVLGNMVVPDVLVHMVVPDVVA